MTNPSLKELADRVEAGEGEDRELGELVHAALLPDHRFCQIKDAPAGVGCEMYRWPDGDESSALNITGSAEAAIYFAKKMRPDVSWSLHYHAGDIETPRCRVMAVLYDGEKELVETEAYTPARALLAALLKAIDKESEASSA